MIDGGQKVDPFPTLADIENVPDEGIPEKEEDLDINFKDELKDDFGSMTEIDRKLLLRGSKSRSKKGKRCICYPEDMLRVYWDVVVTS